MNIRPASSSDAAALAAIEAVCFPAAEAAGNGAAHGPLLYHIPAVCVKKTPAAGIVKPRQTRYNKK